MHTVLNKKKNLSVKGLENETIFDSFDAEGIQLKHGCLAGSCGACVIDVESGAELLNELSVIEDNTIKSIKESHPELKDKNLRLTCRARIISKGEIIFNEI